MTFYRYDSHNQDIVLNEYQLIKETPKGYWINVYYNEFNKWVSKTSIKRYAYPTKKEALNSFIQRKIRQQGILKNQLKMCENHLMDGLIKYKLL